MDGRYLLDTSIVIALFGKDSAIIEQLRNAEHVFISSIALGELYYGAERSARVDENKLQIDAFASGTTVLECDSGTAREYASVKNLLRAKGSPIPENDIWIAATAQQHDLTLVARDDHFLQIDGLSTDSW